LKSAMDDNHKTVLTNCPSCLQGLGRSRDLGIKPQHVVVELATKYAGQNWQRQFETIARHATAVRF